MAHPRLRSIFFDQSLFSSQQQGGLPGANPLVWIRLLYHFLADEVLGGQAPPLPFQLIMTGPDIMEWQMTMFELIGRYDGVLQLEPEGTPPPPNHPLWHFSMLPQYDPMGTLEPWLCLNCTSNPHLVRWMNTHVNEDVRACEVI